MVFTEPVFYKVIIQCPLCTVPDLDLGYGRYELNKSDIVNHLIYMLEHCKHSTLVDFYFAPNKVLISNVLVY